MCASLDTSSSQPSPPTLLYKLCPEGGQYFTYDYSIKKQVPKKIQLLAFVRLVIRCMDYRFRSPMPRS